MQIDPRQLGAELPRRCYENFCGAGTNGSLVFVGISESVYSAAQHRSLQSSWAKNAGTMRQQRYGLPTLQTQAHDISLSFGFVAALTKVTATHHASQRKKGRRGAGPSASTGGYRLAAGSIVLVTGNRL